MKKFFSFFELTENTVKFQTNTGEVYSVLLNQFYFGFYAEKFLTHFVGHSAILVAGILTGPAAPATIAALGAIFFPLIEGTSNAVGLGCGIGPV